MRRQSNIDRLAARARMPSVQASTARAPRRSATNTAARITLASTVHPIASAILCTPPCSHRTCECRLQPLAGFGGHLPQRRVARLQVGREHREHRGAVVRDHVAVHTVLLDLRDRHGFAAGAPTAPRRCAPPHAPRAASPSARTSARETRTPGRFATLSGASAVAVCGCGCCARTRRGRPGRAQAMRRSGHKGLHGRRCEMGAWTPDPSRRPPNAQQGHAWRRPAAAATAPRQHAGAP